jgi:NAD(P)-dependent dehydrogenase (short-subunit alcohol dehydrogenase family)
MSHHSRGTAVSDSKVILVTGASSGFGALTVRTLADAGHDVFAGMRDIAGRNAESAAAAAQYADEHGVVLRAVEMDVSDQDSIDHAVAAVLGSAGRIDVLIHNAGHMVLACRHREWHSIFRCIRSELGECARGVGRRQELANRVLNYTSTHALAAVHPADVSWAAADDLEPEPWIARSTLNDRAPSRISVKVV